MALVVVAVCVSLYSLPHAHARSADGFGRMERLLNSLRGSAESSAALGELRGAGEASAAHPLEKRQIYDRSCKGVYDRSLFNKLEHVCDDCYNLYRTSFVYSSCRRECFDNEMFNYCVKELQLPSPGEYILIRDALRG
uniref:Hyperglycemic hormone PO preproprotein n=1 Tax=Gecarcoidea natalis TaxID=45628 RepID=A1E291_9EUCA|nr:hyperglycemic hormone PO preproprotein [Gecarcoidea natalis]